MLFQFQLTLVSLLRKHNIYERWQTFLGEYIELRWEQTNKISDTTDASCYKYHNVNTLLSDLCWSHARKNRTINRNINRLWVFFSTLHFKKTLSMQYYIVCARQGTLKLLFHELQRPQRNNLRTKLAAILINLSKEIPFVVIIGQFGSVIHWTLTLRCVYSYAVSL